jgi:3-hydroxyisobutyrate dehydrogenase-like beta-hydroxyacid dehydrogenase
MKTRVGFIGLGEMGKWMALNIDHLAEEMLKIYRGESKERRKELSDYKGGKDETIGSQ